MLWIPRDSCDVAQLSEPGPSWPWWQMALSSLTPSWAAGSPYLTVNSKSSTKTSASTVTRISMTLKFCNRRG